MTRSRPITVPANESLTSLAGLTLATSGGGGGRMSMISQSSC